MVITGDTGGQVPLPRSQRYGASLSIAAGSHPKLISARLGHSSIQITMDRYGHLFPSAHEELAERLDATFAAAEVAKPAVASVTPIR